MLACWNVRGHTIHCTDNRPVCVTEQGLLRQPMDVALIISSAVKLSCLWNTKIIVIPLLSLFITGCCTQIKALKHWNIAKLYSENCIKLNTLWHFILSVSPSPWCLSHLKNSSCLKELQGLLYGIVQPMVASSGQIGSDKTHSYHQPPGEQRGQEKKKSQYCLCKNEQTRFTIQSHQENRNFVRRCLSGSDIIHTNTVLANYINHAMQIYLHIISLSINLWTWLEIMFTSFIPV